MNPPLDRVFVYGTLHPEHPQYNRYLVEEWMGVTEWYPVTTLGTRRKSDYPWDLVWFHEDGDEFPGAVLVLKDTPRDLAMLDQYEGFREGRQYNHFVRKLITVTRTDGTTEMAWGYEWGRTQDAERDYLAGYAEPVGA